MLWTTQFRVNKNVFHIGNARKNENQPIMENSCWCAGILHMKRIAGSGKHMLNYHNWYACKRLTLHIAETKLNDKMSNKAIDALNSTYAYDNLQNHGIRKYML